MNFKYLLPLIFFLTACGLKTKPTAPRNTALPSIPDSYFSHPPLEEKNDDEKK